MGQLCSRPKTIEDKPAAAPSFALSPGDQQRDSAATPNGLHHRAPIPHTLLASQRSDAELSELDVVVQQLRDNHNSVTGSAPELLQQWDHDHRVVLDSMDAAIQVHDCMCWNHLPGCQLHSSVAALHTPQL